MKRIAIFISCAAATISMPFDAFANDAYSVIYEKITIAGANGYNNLVGFALIGNTKTGSVFLCNFGISHKDGKLANTSQSCRPAANSEKSPPGEYTFSGTKFRNEPPMYGYVKINQLGGNVSFCGSLTPESPVIECTGVVSIEK